MAEPVTPQRDTAGWFGHPRGLSTLFFTEMWERFSFYGLKALLILFMTAAATQGGLGFTDQRAGNVGAFVAPLVVGTLGQNVNWHVGFACAGVGMIIGLIQYVAGKPRLMPALERLGQSDTHAARSAEPWWRFQRDEWGRVAAIAVLFVFSSIFWGAFEQASSSLNLFADRLTRNTAFGYNFPSTWYQSLNSMFMIFGLAPLIGGIWVRMGDRQPSSPVKFSLGLLFVGLGFALIVPAAMMTQQGIKVSPWWLIGLYFLHTIGELCLSPVGLSMVTKLAPARIVGFMMGVWFFATAMGNYVAGWVAGLVGNRSFSEVFMIAFVTAAIATLVLAVLILVIKRMM